MLFVNQISIKLGEKNWVRDKEHTFLWKKEECHMCHTLFGNISLIWAYILISSLIVPLVLYLANSLLIYSFLKSSIWKPPFINGKIKCIHVYFQFNKIFGISVILLWFLLLAFEGLFVLPIGYFFFFILSLGN